jgi:hypothetical protein
MHHFEDFKIVEDPTSYDVIYRNDHTGEEITVKIPRAGVFEDPNREATREDVRRVAQNIGRILSTGFSGGGTASSGGSSASSSGGGFASVS